MNKRKYILLALLLLFTFARNDMVFANSTETNITSDNLKPSENEQYKHYKYVIDEYNINIVVNENNTYDITETIKAYFNIPQHGIYRSIPLRNTITRLDGTTNHNRAVISNLKVNQEYTASKKDGQYIIKIGNPDKLITMEQEYVISYNYNIGKDRSSEYDELYFNIIGDKWESVIGNITFTITMPKDFDSSKLGFSSGYVGSTDSSNVTYSVDGNIITGRYNGILNPGEALTVRAELPEGYFVNAGYPTNPTIYLYFIVPIVCLLISIFLWFKFGRDDEVISTVEFYPPGDFNSLELAFLYKGKADNKDVTSLLIYLANKGYIKIAEVENKTLFGTTNSFEIIKLKDYDGNNYCEREFLEGLFQKEIKLFGVSEATYSERTAATKNDLYNSFYKTTQKILKNTNSKDNKKVIFERSASSKSTFLIIMTIISLLTIIIIPTIDYGEKNQFFSTIFITLILMPFYLAGLFNDMKIFERIIWLGVISLFYFVFFQSMPLGFALKEDYTYLIGFIFGILCTLGMGICFKYLPKRTKYGNEILGKIQGFKDFLETTEKDRLEAMVKDDPDYFYNILPFTYVLGISSKWIKQFETINMKSPDWYDSPHSFDMNHFGDFMNSTMTSAQSAMSSSPSGSSGGSGGGSSGGGSGGGGGGSW